MKSKSWGSGALTPKDTVPKSSTLKSWECKAIDAVASVISFWGFKENHGKIWALLFIKNKPMRSLEIQNLLGLSKGAVSMLIQDLEEWNVVLVEKNKKPRTYIANENIAQMINEVFQQREAGLLKKIKVSLQEAYTQAREEKAPAGMRLSKKHEMLIFLDLSC